MFAFGLDHKGAAAQVPGANMRRRVRGCGIGATTSSLSSSRGMQLGCRFLSPTVHDRGKARCALEWRAARVRRPAHRDLAGQSLPRFLLARVMESLQESNYPGSQTDMHLIDERCLGGALENASKWRRIDVGCGCVRACVLAFRQAWAGRVGR